MLNIERKRLELYWEETFRALDFYFDSPLRNHDSVLDVCCGEGLVLDWLDAYAWETHGIDTCNETTRYSTPEIHQVEVGDIRDGRYNGLGFYLVTMINKLDDREGVLDAIRKCMDPLGSFIVIHKNAYRLKLHEHPAFVTERIFLGGGEIAIHARCKT